MPCYYAPQIPMALLVEHDGGLCIVDLRPEGWRDRRPYRGHRRGLLPVPAGEAAVQLAHVGYQPRSGEAARSGPSVPEAERSARLLSLRLDPALRARLDAEAEVHGSRPAALRAWLDAYDRERGRREG